MNLTATFPKTLIGILLRLFFLHFQAIKAACEPLVCIYVVKKVQNGPISVREVKVEWL